MIERGEGRGEHCGREGRRGGRAGMVEREGGERRAGMVERGGGEGEQ